MNTTSAFATSCAKTTEVRKSFGRQVFISYRRKDKKERGGDKELNDEVPRQQKREKGENIIY